VELLAHLEPTFAAQLSRAFGRRPLFVGLVIGATALLWLWSAWDAYRSARARRKSGPWIFILVLVVFFALGWQVSQIDLVQMITDAPKAWTPLSRVLWPWEAAVTRESRVLEAAAPVQVPCTDHPPAPPERVAGRPYIAAQPTCGELSRVGTDNQVIPGTPLTLTGEGFEPDTRTEIWWEDPLLNQFQIRQGGEYLATTTDAGGAFRLEVVMPYRLLPTGTGEVQTHRLLARQRFLTGAVHPSEPLLLTIERMVETIIMGMMATLFGILFAIPVSFLAARNLMAHSWITVAVYYLTRTILNIIRAIEPLIWALIAVVWVGLTVHSIASLGKLYSEAIEGIDPGPIEAVQATGATRLQTIAYAVVPQMLSPFVSFSIYRWDINVRMSTVIGLVGGGGIGFLLVQYIRLLDYRAAGIAVWFIAFTVAVLDYVSAEIRERFV
jgi:phosphonate transport system permease protein